MKANERLAGAMNEMGFTRVELAEAVNRHLRAHGYEGTVSDRTVRHWLTGRTRWPHPRQRAALEAVCGKTAEELGFVPPAGRHRPTTTSEVDVRRREFLAATTGTTAAVAGPFPDTRAFAIGTSDVMRLRADMERLTALDAARGGHAELEGAALAGASKALDLQRRSASQRVRQRLFGLAGDYTCAAAWSALDDHQSGRAQAHLDRALYLAGMARDATAEMRVWNLYAMLANQRRQFATAVHSAQAAQATTVTRRDPLFASLAHARAATAYSRTGDRQAALRCLGNAQESLGKTELDKPRPVWIAFYGPGELLSLTATVRDRTGDPAEAEAAAHRSLSGIPEQYVRNRSLATAQLALAQLHQHEVDRACASADRVFDLMSGHPLPGRMRSLLGDFYRDLLSEAPDAEAAREWGDRYRTEWSRTR